MAHPFTKSVSLPQESKHLTYLLFVPLVQLISCLWYSAPVQCPAECPDSPCPFGLIMREDEGFKQLWAREQVQKALGGRDSKHWKAELTLVCVSRSVMSDSATPRPVARQAPLSMGLSRQEYWSGLPCPPPGALPDQEFWVINSDNTLFIRTDEQVINSEEVISADLYWSVFFLPFPPFLFPQ